MSSWRICTAAWRTNRSICSGSLGERRLGDLLQKEIADELNISSKTVETHIRHIYEKLNVQNAPAAIHQAYKAGLFPE